MRATLAALIVGASLVACSSSIPPIPPITSRVGLTLGSITQADIIYDLSFPVLGLEASFNGGSAGGAWTIVADCTAENGHVLGVIPASGATSKLVTQAVNGEFESFLLECG